VAYTGYINKEVQAMYGIPYSQLTAEQKKILHEDSKRRAKLIKEREDAVLKNNLKAFEDEAKMEKILASIYKNCQKQIIADVTETIAKVEKAGGTWSYANQSALTRSRGLFEQITAELNKLGQKEQITFTQGLGNIYTDQFLRQVYELGQSITVKANFNRLNPALIKQTLDYPWSGAMFSDRLWLDKEKLGRNLRVGLTQSMILGEGIPEITDRIIKDIDTSRYNAERIARTETKRVTYVAHDHAYEDMGVEELKYYTAGMKSSSTVCNICKADNGKIYKRGEEPTLPRHPNCKCVYIPHVPDTFKGNELNELTGSVRGAENYEKWINANKDKINPDGSLKDGWERDWKNGGKLVNKNAPQKSEDKNDKDKVEINIAPITEKAVDSAYEEAYNKYVKDIDRVRNTRAVSRVTNDYLNSVGSNLTRVDLGDLDTDTAKQVSKALIKLDSEWVSTLQEVDVVDYLGYGLGGRCDPYIDKWERTGLDKDLYSRILWDQKSIAPKVALEDWEESILKFPHNQLAIVDKKNYLLPSIYHEYGHSILGGKVSEIYGTNSEVFGKVQKVYSRYKTEVRKINKVMMDRRDAYAGRSDYQEAIAKDAEYKKAQEDLSKIFVSKYAGDSAGEFIAECFTNASLCSKPSPYSAEILKLLREYFGK
jgi:SPP1 gp7 family putative phage head morphogenesis protein